MQCVNKRSGDIILYLPDHHNSQIPSPHLSQHAWPALVLWCLYKVCRIASSLELSLSKHSQCHVQPAVRWIILFITFNPFTPKLKKFILPNFQRENVYVMYWELVIIFHLCKLMKSQVLHAVWCHISGEVVGEIRNSLLSGVIPRVINFKFLLQPTKRQHTVRSTCIFIYYHTQMKDWFCYQFSFNWTYIFLLKGWENVFFELGNYRVRIMQSDIMIALKFLAICPPTNNTSTNE